MKTMYRRHLLSFAMVSYLSNTIKRTAKGPAEKYEHLSVGQK